jgi:THO complex subunit 4
MSGKLDQSLDEILTSRKKTAPAGRGGRRVGGRTGRKATAAPVGGVSKNVHKVGAKVTGKGLAPNATATSGDSKIIVSNLVSHFI